MTITLTEPALWAVRRDWPDGSHEFVMPRGNVEAAQRAAKKDRAYWLPGPVHPVVAVVQISESDFQAHSRLAQPCRIDVCPGAQNEVR